MKKIPHAQAVNRAIRQVRAAAKKSLKGLNKVAADRMRKGDYATAEAFAGKGREIQQFENQVEELGRVWRSLSARSASETDSTKPETTPLWGYYQPILNALIAAGGQATHEQVESALAGSAGALFKPGDRRPTAQGWERWQQMVHRARKPLRTEGWIEIGTGKVWRITEAGRNAAHQGRQRP